MATVIGSEGTGSETRDDFDFVGAVFEVSGEVVAELLADEVPDLRSKKFFMPFRCFSLDVQCETTRGWMFAYLAFLTSFLPSLDPPRLNLLGDGVKVLKSGRSVSLICVIERR